MPRHYKDKYLTESDKLNDRQRKFALNVMDGMSLVDAYIDAGFGNRDRLAETGKNSVLRSSASKLLKLPKIQNYLYHQRRCLDLSSIMGQEEALMELSLIARARLTDFLTWDMNSGKLELEIKPERKLTGVERAAITEIAGGDNPKIKMFDKMKAIELIMKYHDRLENATNRSGHRNKELRRETLKQRVHRLFGAERE